MTFEIRWVEDLLALEQEKSISRAAELRHITQSAFTRRIQNIQDTLGFQILKIDSKTVNFTDVGQILLSTAKNIKNQMDTTINYLEKNIKDNELSIKFAVSHSLITQFFPQFIQNLYSDYDDIRLEIIASNLHQGIYLLKEGSCDFLICYCDQMTLQQLDQSLFSYHKIVNMEIVPVTICKNNQPKYSFNKNFPLLAYSCKAYLRQCVDKMIEGKLNYKILYETDNAGDLKALALHGLGVAWLPKLLIEGEINEGKLQIIDNCSFFQDINIIRSKVTYSKKINFVWNYLLK